MKRLKIVCFFLLFSAFFFLPQIQPVHAEDKPSYVGVRTIYFWRCRVCNPYIDPKKDKIMFFYCSLKVNSESDFNENSFEK